MNTSFDLTLQIVLTVLAGISAQVLAAYLKLPSIILLLIFGVSLGPDGIGLLNPKMLGVGLEVIVSLCVALILFEGGLSLELREVGKVSGSLRNLITLGTFITLLGGGMAAHWLGEFPWPIAFLYASLVVVTGPTVVTPLLRQVKVERKVGTLLEGEGVLIDPVGAILAVVVLDIILSGDTGLTFIVPGLLLRLSVGAAIGGLGGVLLGFFLKRAQFLSEELRNLVVLAGLWGLFGLAQSVRGESGLMAAVTAGIVVRSLSIPDERLLRRFKGQLTIFSVSVLFVLLAADLSIASVFELGRGSLLTVLALMLLIRPLNVWLCTWDSDLTWKQKTFLSWISPRGIVSASVASLFAILLTERGITGGDSIKALVFLTIMMTVLIQGLTARWLAQLLGLTSDSATGVVIVGCNPLGLMIGRLFKDRGESVVIIDTDEEACRSAEAEGFRVYISSALDANVLEDAGLSSIGTFLAITNNGEVNSVVADRAAAEFQPPRVFAVLPRETDTNNKPTSRDALLLPRLSVKTWNSYIKDNRYERGEIQLTQSQLEAQRDRLNKLIRNGDMIPLALQRDEKLDLALVNSDWRAGDRLTYLLHDPTPQLLKRLSGGRSPSRLAVEPLTKADKAAATAETAASTTVKTMAGAAAATAAAVDSPAEAGTDADGSEPNETGQGSDQNGADQNPSQNPSAVAADPQIDP
ncbi:cation:proton antiporter [Romeria aff. gracilis LEGE 07310]|uniref:Cation:proton antiporter n=1 Tax=Vasconcelosia minhoensis LEGE 07310 TaxID=915328 RepID=A0A8J7A6D2_9CYAN|nr:sodium:proton antiporter [Romeria gracilis]MBE9076720.1 cation:proton antiporter [Romeria aff. gracilis LEGE 07310]